VTTLDPARRQPRVRPRVTVMDRVLIGTVLVHGMAGLAGGHHWSWLQPLDLAAGAVIVAHTCDTRALASSQEEAMTAAARRAQPSLKVLVAHASRHGSTAQIAQRLARRLGEAGLEAVMVWAARVCPAR